MTIKISWPANFQALTPSRFLQGTAVYSLTGPDAELNILPHIRAQSKPDLLASKLQEQAGQQWPRLALHVFFLFF